MTVFDVMCVSKRVLRTGGRGIEPVMIHAKQLIGKIPAVRLTTRIIPEADSACMHFSERIAPRFGLLVVETKSVLYNPGE